MKNKYMILKERQQKEVDNLPIKAAFSNEQFNRMMRDFGLTTSKEDISKIYKIGYGCFAKLEDKEKINECFNKHYDELVSFLEDYDNLKQALLYELGNHEFCITYDPTDTFRSLGLTYDEVMGDQMKKNAYIEAKNEYLKWCEENN